MQEKRTFKIKNAHHHERYALERTAAFEWKREMILHYRHVFAVW